MKEFFSLLFKGLYQLAVFWLAMAGVVVVNLTFVRVLDNLRITRSLNSSSGETYLILIMCTFSIAAVFKVFIIGSKAKGSSHT